ncbi:hypothetical protein M3J09_009811 [Ascochyta lentis]
MTITPDQWTKAQREGWLCKLYATCNADGIRALPPGFVLSQLLDALEDLLSYKLSPEDTATRSASLILSEIDVSTPWTNVVGMVLDAATTFNDEKILITLIDYLVELASLPDAINKGPGVKTIDVGGGEIWQIQPDQAIVFAEGKLWRDLPTYSWNVTENFQGPELWLHCLSAPATPLAAMQAWRNLNTYLALMAVHPKAQTVPALAGKARLGLTTLGLALENSPGTRRGKVSELHAPAAAQWLRVAGDEIERLCEEETEQIMAGDLWKCRGGTDMCNSARMAFWKSRLMEMGY